MTALVQPIGSALTGFGAGLSLIVAIGAQNAFVLRQGIRKEHVLPVVAVCAISDAILIVLGIAGLGIVVEKAPVAIEILRWFGAAFLLIYGFFAARRAFKPEALVAEGTETSTSLTTAVVTVVALTWLNPHVYLDTVVLLGSIANAQGDGRWWFALGAILASIAWFSGLGFGARLLAGFMAKPVAWRVLDTLVAVVMVTLGILLIVRPIG